MDINTIIGVVTFFVTLIMGQLVKKFDYINTKRIPIQNLLIGVLSFVITFLFTKDINYSLLGVGLLAGGTYDFFKNLGDL